MSTRIDIRTQASTGEWVRPAGWLALPDISTTDKKAVGIFAVYENEENACSIAIGTSLSIAYTINWGDGTSVSVSGTSTQTKRFNYASLSSVVLQDASGYNYKQSLVTITFVSGTATSIDLGPTITQGGSNNWLDIACNWSTGYLRFGTRRASLLQRLQVFSANYTGINLNNNCSSLTSLRKLVLPTIVTGVGSSQQTFSFMGNVDSFDLDWTTGSTAYGFFQSAMMTNLGNIRIVGHTGSSGSIFYSCQNLKTVKDVDVSGATNLGYMFGSCVNLEKIGTITNTANTNLQYAFIDCSVLREIVFTSVANVTNYTGTFAYCFSLRKLRLPGAKESFTIASCNMQRAELVDLFNDLATVVGKTIAITDNPGVADLTAADILIATAKGWTVTL